MHCLGSEMCVLDVQDSELCNDEVLCVEHGHKLTSDAAQINVDQPQRLAHIVVLPYKLDHEVEEVESLVF